MWDKVFIPLTFPTFPRVSINKVLLQLHFNQQVPCSPLQTRSFIQLHSILLPSLLPLLKISNFDLPISIFSISTLKLQWRLLLGRLCIKGFMQNFFTDKFSTYGIILGRPAYILSNCPLWKIWTNCVYMRFWFWFVFLAIGYFATLF